ncbi:hypothetical protein [uncultured Nostoc sp.]|uniref:hypothetical protein n=1 Tax=uncultured Nostoc sp. TaxID=340711 RepID=UPI0035CB23BF
MRVASLSLEPVEKYCLELADYQVSFRLPNSLDIIAIAKHKQPEIDQEILLERCILQAVCNSEYLPLAIAKCWLNHIQLKQIGWSFGLQMLHRVSILCGCGLME